MKVEDNGDSNSVIVISAELSSESGMPSSIFSWLFHSICANALWKIINPSFSRYGLNIRADWSL